MQYLNLLTVVFIVLKLASVISWPWLIVLIPSIIYFGFIALALIFVSILAALAMIISKIND